MLVQHNLVLSCFRVCLASVAFLIPAALWGDDGGLAAYKDGNYAVAIPLLQKAVANTPEAAPLQAALLSALVYEGRVDEAMAADRHDAQAFAASPEVIAARGEYAFYMADMPQAEKLFRSALQLNENTPRAFYGMSRLYRAASFYRSGRLSCIKAHQLDPDDALITQAFLRYTPAEKRRELIGPFAAAHPWLYKRYQENEENDFAIDTAVEGKKLFESENGPQETTLHFVYLMRDAHDPRGVGLELRIGNGHSLRMLFDTGASGILVKQSAVDKAGLAHLGSSLGWGIGDGGSRNVFSALADTCQIATLKFKNCLVKALEGKRAIAGDEDGLIGADFFQDYIVEIDFQKRLLHLRPLPTRPENPQGYNRTVSPEEKDFTPVFRFGHMLYVSTTVNRKCTGLFLLDTGTEVSNIDSTFARLSTKLHGQDWMRIKGVSGDVKNVFEADKADLEFGRFRQNNAGLAAFNMNNSPYHQDVRSSGILGISLLSFFRLTIDYRNGLVKFDYVLK